MNLKHLTDDSLLFDTKLLASKERAVTTSVLHHLKEIDRRKLYSDLGYSSLFDYCRRELRYSEGSAQRRIQAARLLSDIPELSKKIESGELSLTNVGQAMGFFKAQEIKGIEERKEILDKIGSMSKRECEKKLFELSGDEIPHRESKKRVSETKTQVSIVLTDETLEKFEKLKSLIGGKFTQDELINFMAEAAIQKIEKQKFKVSKSQEPVKGKDRTVDNTPKPKEISPPPAVKPTRYIKAKVKRDVYQRDKFCQQCGSIHNLNFDHQQPFALGGDATAKNIRLLCFNCNQRSRIKAKL